MRKPTKENLGDLLVRSLTEARDGLRGRAGKLTMKTLEIPDPPHFSAAAVHRRGLRCPWLCSFAWRYVGGGRVEVETIPRFTPTTAPVRWSPSCHPQFARWRINPTIGLGEDPRPGLTHIVPDPAYGRPPLPHLARA